MWYGLGNRIQHLIDAFGRDTFARFHFAAVDDEDGLFESDGFVFPSFDG